MTPTTSTSGSATSAQVISSPTRTGTIPRGRNHPARSITSQIAISGTAVPICPRDSRTTKTATPSWGANNRPAVSSIRGQAWSRGTSAALPRASSTAKTTTSV